MSRAIPGRNARRASSQAAAELLLGFGEATQVRESRATPEARLQRCLDAGSGCNPCHLVDQGQDDLRLVRLHRVHAGEDEGAFVCALEAWLERLRRAGRSGQGARAFESGDRNAPRFLRAVLEPPCDRCVRGLELQEQNRVIAARTARALEVRARIIGPLELLCRFGCTQPGARAITRRDPVGLRCAPIAPSQAPADRAPRPRMRVRLAARAPAACRPAPSR